MRTPSQGLGGSPAQPESAWEQRTEREEATWEAAEAVEVARLDAAATAKDAQAERTEDARQEAAGDSRWTAPATDDAKKRELAAQLSGVLNQATVGRATGTAPLRRRPRLPDHDRRRARDRGRRARGHPQPRQLGRHQHRRHREGAQGAQRAPDRRPEAEGPRAGLAGAEGQRGRGAAAAERHGGRQAHQPAPRSGADRRHPAHEPRPPPPRPDHARRQARALRLRREPRLRQRPHDPVLQPQSRRAAAARPPRRQGDRGADQRAPVRRAAGHLRQDPVGRLLHSLPLRDRRRPRPLRAKYP